MRILKRARNKDNERGKDKGAANNIFNLKYNIPKGNSVLFHNGSNFDYHVIMKDIANKFEGEFTCLGKNTETYKALAVPITKEVKRIDKNGNLITKTKSYKLQFIDSVIFKARL